MSFDPTCIFCKIVQKLAPASIIFDNELVMAFLDIRPLTMGHTLVIPKKHYVDIFDVPNETLSKVHITSKRIAPAIKTATNADGISIIQQNGKSAGQDIFHLHVHIVPRFEGQKLPHFHELKEVDRQQLEIMAQRIKRCL